MRAEKQLLLDEIKEQIDNPYGIALTSYEKIDANATANFRDRVYKSGATYLVVRKRVFFKAAAELGLEIDESVMKGHIGIFLTGENVVDATKVLCEFKDDNKDQVAILGGRYDGKMCTSAEIDKISKLPSKDEMRAQILGLLEAPMANMLGVVDALLTSVPHCLENKVNNETNT